MRLREQIVCTLANGVASEGQIFETWLNCHHFPVE
jgi:hypothetical protein